MLKRDKKHFKHTFKMAIVPATTFNYAAGRKRSNQANTIIMEISVTFTIRSRGADKKTPADWRRGSPQLWLTKKWRSGESGRGEGVCLIRWNLSEFIRDSRWRAIPSPALTTCAHVLPRASLRCVQLKHSHGSRLQTRTADPPVWCISVCIYISENGMSHNGERSK